MTLPKGFKEVETPTVELSEFPDGSPCVLMKQELANGSEAKIYLTGYNAMILGKGLREHAQKVYEAHGETEGTA